MLDLKRITINYLKRRNEMAIDLSAIGECEVEFSENMTTGELATAQQKVQEWNLMVTMITNAAKSENEGKLAIARNYK
jgi:hypothetical protein